MNEKHSLVPGGMSAIINLILGFRLGFLAFPRPLLAVDLLGLPNLIKVLIFKIASTGVLLYVHFTHSSSGNCASRLLLTDQHERLRFYDVLYVINLDENISRARSQVV